MSMNKFDLIVVYSMFGNTQLTRTKQTRLLIDKLKELSPEKLNVCIYYNSYENYDDASIEEYSINSDIKLFDVRDEYYFKNIRVLSRIPRFLHDVFYSKWVNKVIQHLDTCHVEDFSTTTLLTISYPFMSHNVGLKLKKKFPDVHWISFFSDVWPQNILPKPYKEWSLFKNFKTSKLINVLTNSDQLIVTNKVAMNLFLETVKREGFENKIKVLNHLGTPIKIDSSVKNSSQRKSQIVHIGTIDKYRASNINLDILNILARHFCSEIIQIGSLSKSVKKHLDSKLSGIIYYKKHISDIGKINISADYLLLIEANMESIFVPSKLSDYLLSNKPIIAITNKDSPTHELLKEFGFGFIVYMVNGHVRIDEVERLKPISESYKNLVDEQVCNIFYNERRN